MICVLMSMVCNFQAALTSNIIFNKILTTHGGRSLRSNILWLPRLCIMYYSLSGNLHMRLYTIVLKLMLVSYDSFVFCNFRPEANLHSLCSASMTSIKPWLYRRRVHRVIRVCGAAWWRPWSWGTYGLKHISLAISRTTYACISEFSYFWIMI
jgi:hypothetical protein